MALHERDARAYMALISPRYKYRSKGGARIVVTAVIAQELSEATWELIAEAHERDARAHIGLLDVTGVDAPR